MKFKDEEPEPNSKLHEQSRRQLKLNVGEEWALQRFCSAVKFSHHVKFSQHAKFSQPALCCCGDDFLTAFCGFLPNCLHCILCRFIFFCNFLDFEQYISLSQAL